jgi:hypothetical protein
MSHSVRTLLLAAAVALLSAALLVVMARPAHAAGSAEVRFVQPERFADIGRYANDRERALAALTAHVQQLAQRLPDGQRLRLEVTDVDLAGEQTIGRAYDVRVLRGTADWPRIEMRWSLEQGGQTLKSGEERLTDLGYPLMRGATTSEREELPYEKRLLTKWFDAQFGAAR